MSRIRYIVLSLVFSAASLAWLVSAMPAAAQFSSHPAGYHLTPIAISDYGGYSTSPPAGLSWSGNTLMLDNFSDSGGHWIELATYTGTEQIVGIAARITDLSYSDPSTQYFEMIPHSSWRTGDTRTSVSSYDLSPDFWWFHSYSQTARASVSNWITDDLGSPYKDPIDLFSTTFSQPLGAFSFKKNSGHITSASIDIYLILAGNPPAPPPPPDWEEGFYHSGFCNFTTTITTTAESGSIISATEVYSQPANLLANPSFEEGSGSPASWQDEGTTGYWVFGGRTGSQAVRNYPTQLKQTVQLRGLSGYEAGIYARCDSVICGGDSVPVVFNGQTLATATDIVTDWVPYSGTVVSGLPNSLFTIDLDKAQNGDVIVDDAWLWPVDAAGNVNCDPDLYPPPDGGPDDTYSGPPDCVIDPRTNTCITIPTGGAGEICYFCGRPASVSPDSVSLWIAWLGCVIRNMFSCDMRLWFAELNNTARALQNTLVTLSNFLAAAGQDGANATAARAQAGANYAGAVWAEWAGYLAAAPRQVTVVVSTVVEAGESGIDWANLIWEIISFLFLLFFSLIQSLYEGAEGTLNMVIGAIKMIRQALTAPPIDLVAELGMSGADPTAPTTFYAGDEIQGAALVSRLLYGMAIADQMIVDYGLYPVVYVVLGVLGLGIISWVIYQWRDGIVSI